MSLFVFENIKAKTLRNIRNAAMGVLHKIREAPPPRVEYAALSDGFRKNKCRQGLVGHDSGARLDRLGDGVQPESRSPDV